MAINTENIFRAVEVITEKYINELQFDKTSVCKIVDNSKRDKGVYIVSDGSSEFEAYSENLSYSNNTQVDVMIPNGDYNQQKKIIGKHIVMDGESYVYTPPLEYYVDITNNLMPDEDREIEEFSLLANGSIKEKLIYASTEKLNFVGYNRLGIKADFMSWLKTLKVSSGHYGLKIVVNTEQTTTADGELLSNSYKFYLDSKDMYGNPYSFENYYTQEKLLSMASVTGTITGFEVYFYQDKDFIDENSVFIDYGDFIPSDNLFVKNIYVSMGYDYRQFDKDTVLLYTLDSNTYNYKKADYVNNKHLQMRWIQVQEDSINVIDKQHEIPDDAIVHWYEYKLGTDPVIDPIAGAFWVEIPDALGKMECIVIPDTTLSTNKYKVVIEYPQGTYYSSEALEFTTEVSVVDFGTVDLIQGLKILCDEDGHKGTYLLYDMNDELQNPIEGNKYRILKAVYNSLITGEEDLDSAAEKITWKIPLTKTMIHKPESKKEYDIEDGITSYREDSEFAYIERSRNNSSSAPSGDKQFGAIDIISVEQTFRIKSHYTNGATNNTVFCYIEKNGITYGASVEMTFGPLGNNGTDYTFLLKFDSDYSCVDWVPKGADSIPVKIVSSLYDYNNDPVWDFTDKTITYSWYSSNPGDSEELLLGIKSGDTIKYYGKNESIQPTTEKEVYIEWNNALDAPSEDNKSMYYILQASCVIKNTNDNNVTLNAYLPIPVRYINTYTEIEGTTKIIYDNKGVNPSYYKEPYHLYQKGQFAPVTDNIKWEVSYVDNNINSSSKYYPFISQNDWNIVPCSMYIEGCSKLICVNASVNNIIVWSQPILIQKYVYSSPLLNSWDGNLTIDEKNGTILSTMLGSGIKENDNTFSGIMMGDVRTGAEDSSITKLGLYGYNHGELSFGWMIDGTGFIGKNKHGQILFDGNKGLIKSGTYEKGVHGMCIDLDGDDNENASLRAYGTRGSVELDTSAGTRDEEAETDRDAIFKVSGRLADTGRYTPLMYVGRSKYYLQSMNYSKTNQTGINFNLSDGRIIGYNFGISAYKSPIENDDGTKEDVTDKYIYMDSSDDKYPFKIGNQFNVQWDGTITALKGVLGSFTLDTRGIYSSGEYVDNLRMRNDGVILLGKNAEIQLNGTNGAAYFNSDVTISGSTTISSNLTISGSTEISGGLTLSGNITGNNWSVITDDKGNAVATFNNINITSGKIGPASITSTQFKFGNTIITKAANDNGVIDFVNSGKIQGTTSHIIITGTNSVEASPKFQVGALGTQVDQGTWNSMVSCVDKVKELASKVAALESAGYITEEKANKTYQLKGDYASSTHYHDSIYAKIGHTHTGTTGETDGHKHSINI